MLVISRKEGQLIKIGSDITITVNQIRGNRVVVGIDAPKEIPITRPEAVFSKLQRPLKFLAEDSPPSL